MLRFIMFLKVGWVILHAIAVTLVFLLGYTVQFKF